MKMIRGLFMFSLSVHDDHNNWWSWWLMIMIFFQIFSKYEKMFYIFYVWDMNEEKLWIIHAQLIHSWWSWRLMIMKIDDHHDWRSWFFSEYFLCVRKYSTLGPANTSKKFETYGLFMFSWSAHDEVISQVRICLESIKHSQSNLTSRPSIHTSETITNHKINTMISQVHSC